VGDGQHGRELRLVDEQVGRHGTGEAVVLDEKVLRLVGDLVLRGGHGLNRGHGSRAHNAADWEGRDAIYVLNLSLFAFGRLRSSLPKALESLFPHPPTPDLIEIGD
jgi:hypothetical protein